MENVIKELEKMEKGGVEILKIYYAEDIEEGSEEWSVDVTQDELNNLCEMSWTWTVMSFDEFKTTLRDSDDLTYICSDWEVVVDKPFSEDIICVAINAWLYLNDSNIKVEMIDVKDAEGSGYVKSLKDRLVKHEDLLK